MDSATQEIPVGIVVERRKASTPWTDWVWRPLGVLPGVPDMPPWSQLTSTEREATFFAGPATLMLYRSQTARYRDNVTSETPALWVVLRSTGGEPPYQVLAVTADPAEGEGYTETGTDVVEAVTMPAPIREAIEAYVLAHHVERPFIKRQRDRADPEALARRGPAGEGNRR